MKKVAKKVIKKSKKQSIPLSFKQYLWSYDFDKLDKEKNKSTIIQSVLELGRYEDTKKLFTTYSMSEIKNVLKTIKPSMFNKRAINYWNSILN